MNQALHFRGALTTVTPTKRSIGGEYPVVKPVANYITIPSFALVNDFSAYPRILRLFKYNIVGQNVFAFTNLRRLKNLSFVPVVSFEANGVKTRYKLWSDSDITFYADAYTGQRIPTAFDIEIWSKLQDPIISTYGIQLITSILSFPPKSALIYGTDVGVRRDCTDKLFSINPPIDASRGEYITFDDCGVGTVYSFTELGPRISLGILYLRCVDDGNFYAIRIVKDGSIYAPYVIPAPIAPPVEGTDSLLMISTDAKFHEMVIRKDEGLIGYSIKQEGESAPSGVLSIVLTCADDDTNHTVTFITDDGYTGLSINQTAL